ncbi:MAG TPA: PKD domain-containing protein [Bacteroidales bacterium]|nr:PKD domain-containing protein [Bacteroidales bacterium]HQO06626.1 PKD domain-containing protein [Bacteroidales bacterium]HQP52706.1 PKD domain-containing protein [Bacteroidales bacterium]
MRILTLVSFMVFVLFWSACSKDKGDKKEVKAAFSWELIEEPGKVLFTNLSSNAVSYEWNFDDGTSSTVASPTKVYNRNGEYIVTLKAFGEKKIHSVYDTVTVDNIVTR